MNSSKISSIPRKFWPNSDEKNSHGSILADRTFQLSEERGLPLRALAVRPDVLEVPLERPGRALRVGRGLFLF